MNTRTPQPLHNARGMVLITTLLLLIVVTLLALAMFRGVGTETRVAGNVMDKQRALQAATSTQGYGEQWLVNNAGTTTLTACTSTSFAASPAICSNTLAASTDAGSASIVPWNIANAAVGYGYNPVVSGTNLFPTTGGADSFTQVPTVYIAELGTDATYANAVDYQVDAWSYGGSNSTVAVVESIYQIRYTATGGGGP